MPGGLRGPSDRHRARQRGPRPTREKGRALGARDSLFRDIHAPRRGVLEVRWANWQRGTRTRTHLTTQHVLSSKPTVTVTGTRMERPSNSGPLHAQVRAPNTPLDRSARLGDLSSVNKTYCDPWTMATLQIVGSQETILPARTTWRSGGRGAIEPAPARGRTVRDEHVHHPVSRRSRPDSHHERAGRLRNPSEGDSRRSRPE